MEVNRTWRNARTTAGTSSMNLGPKTLLVQERDRNTYEFSTCKENGPNYIGQKVLSRREGSTCEKAELHVVQKESLSFQKEEQHSLGAAKGNVIKKLSKKAKPGPFQKKVAHFFLETAYKKG